MKDSKDKMDTQKELKTRLVFIDTCAYESKNFNFGINSLGRTQRYIEEGKIHLLLPDITKSEIEKHIWDNAEAAEIQLRSILKQKPIKILQIADGLPFSGQLEIPKKEEIFEKITDKFKDFIASPNVELISTENVSPKDIFERYFNSRPPFNNPNKKHEFPDAFVLEAINKISQERGYEVYIISNDNDMKSYILENSNLIHLNNINELNDLIIHNDKSLSEPVKFADQVFEYLRPQIIELAEELLSESEFEPSEFLEYFYDDVIEFIHIDLIEICEKNLEEVHDFKSLFQICIEVTLTVDFSIPDYENSPWDSEDKTYIFIEKEKFSCQYKQKYSAHISLIYEDGIINNSEILELYFDNFLFELNRRVN